MGEAGMQVAQNRVLWRVLVNTEMKLLVPSRASNFLSRWETVIWTRRTVLHGVISIVVIFVDIIIVYF